MFRRWFKLTVREVCIKAKPVFKKYPGVTRAELCGSCSRILKGKIQNSSELEFLIDVEREPKRFHMGDLVNLKIDLEDTFNREVHILQRHTITDPDRVLYVASPANVVIIPDQLEDK